METYTPAETPKPKQESEGRSFWEGGKQESILESRDDSEDTDVENQGILAFCRILPEKSAINGNVTVNMPSALCRI